MLTKIAALAAALTFPFPPVSPQPSASPQLKEIGRVRSTLYCSMLSKRIAPALRGLMTTDEAIGAGHRAMSRMGDDVVTASTGRMALDRQYLGQVVEVSAHNLEVVHKLLNDPTYFKFTAGSEEARSATSLKSHLEDVATEQNSATNILNGTLETDLLGQMQTERNMAMSSVTGSESAPHPSPAGDQTTFLSVAGLPNYPPDAAFSQRNLIAGSTVIKHTPYDALVSRLESQQIQIARSERVATQAVLEAVPFCAAPPSPAPSPT